MASGKITDGLSKYSMTCMYLDVDLVLSTLDAPVQGLAEVKKLERLRQQIHVFLEGACDKPHGMKKWATQRARSRGCTLLLNIPNEVVPCCEQRA